MRRYRNLSPASVRTLRATIGAIRPRGHGFDHPIDEDVLAEIDRSIPFLPGPLRLSLPVGLRLLEWGPPFWLRRWERMSSLPPEVIREYCRLWLASRFAAFRTLMMGIRALVMLVFYQHPDVVRSMDVRWSDRYETTIRLRADTLEEPARDGTSG